MITDQIDALNSAEGKRLLAIEIALRMMEIKGEGDPEFFKACIGKKPSPVASTRAMTSKQ